MKRLRMSKLANEQDLNDIAQLALDSEIVVVSVEEKAEHLDEEHVLKMKTTEA